MQTAVELEVNGLTLRGMLHRPENCQPSPMVVAYHGFTGQKTESHFLFVKLSRALAAAGLACLRFDFSGSGESDGDFAAMTFGGEIAEAKAVLDYARSLPFANPARIFLVGLSMGGAIASIVAGDEPAKTRAIVLLAPAGNMPALIEARITPEAKAQLATEGRIDIGGHWLGKEFCEELQAWAIYERAKLSRAVSCCSTAKRTRPFPSAPPNGTEHLRRPSRVARDSRRRSYFHPQGLGK